MFAFDRPPTFFSATRLSSCTGERALVAKGLENDSDLIIVHMSMITPSCVTTDLLHSCVREMIQFQLPFCRIYSFSSIFSAIDFYMFPLPLMSMDIYVAEPLPVQGKWNRKMTVITYTFPSFTLVLSKFRQGVLASPLKLSSDKKNLKN